MSEKKPSVLHLLRFNIYKEAAAPAQSAATSLPAGRHTVDVKPEAAECALEVSASS